MGAARSFSAFSFLGLLAAVAFVAASVAPHDRFFLANWVLYWLPVASVLGILAAAGSGLVVVAGAAVALAAFLVGYHAWAQSLTVHEWVWGGYLLAMPGAVAGGLIASRLRRRRSLALAVVAFVAVSATAIGLALNMGLLCVTLMHCHG